LVLAENRGEEQGESGRIEVEASESVLVDDSLLSVNTTSSGHAGTIHVASPSVTFQNGPGFFDLDKREVAGANVPHATVVGASAETAGSGSGGTIAIEAGDLVVTDGASLSARSYGAAATGDAGEIDIRADSMEVSRRADVSAAAWGSGGDGGTIDIEAAEALRVDGSDGPDGRAGYAVIWTSSSNSSWGFLDEMDSVPGAPGAIRIQAGEIDVDNFGVIESACYDCSSKLGLDADGGPMLNDEGRPVGVGSIQIQAESMEVVGSPSKDLPPVVSVATLWDVGDAGRIEIAADSLEVRLGTISAVAYESEGGHAGTIDVTTRSLELERGGILSARTFGPNSGDAGHILVEATDEILISERVGEGTGIFVNSQLSKGDAGTIEISARKLSIEAGGVIQASTFNIPLLSGFERGGDAGDIAINASESIVVSNQGGEVFSLKRTLVDPILNPGEAAAITGILAATVAGGQGGSISLEAPEITVSHGAFVGSTSVGGGDSGPVVLEGRSIHIVDGGHVTSASVLLDRRPAPPIFGGEGGDVELLASESIEVAGVDPHPEATGRSTVSAATFGAGPAGSVTLRITLDAVDEVIVRRGGLVDASSFVPDPEEGGVSSGGNVAVTAGRSIRVEGAGSRIESRTGGRGTGGDVTLQAREIAITNGAVVSARSAPGYQGLRFEILERDGLIPSAPRTARGDAGAVRVSAHELRLVDGGTLAVDSEAADGGAVTVQANELVHLDAGVITTSVAGDTGTASGSVSIDPEVVILQNGSEIVAQAAGGRGGEVTITADNYFAFPGSVVSAEAEKRPELSGTVEVNTPDVNLAGALAELPTNPLDAASQMKEACAARRSGERAGSFAVHAAEGIPPEPDGWLPATVGAGAGAAPAARGGLGTAGATLLTTAGCR
jgi:hypothetical protein